MSEGSINTGIYPNYLNEIGISDGQAYTLVEQAFQTIFFDPEENFCHHTDPDAWCMVDTGNNDARTEGMSYGMMMCVQMDRKDIFDKLWMFSVRYMRMTEGPNAGYFAWSVLPDGTSNSNGPAPDGEEYFAMALFMASARWGDGEGIFNYSAEARDILHHAVHQHEIVSGGEPMWEPENRYIETHTFRLGAFVLLRPQEGWYFVNSSDGAVNNLYTNNTTHLNQAGQSERYGPSGMPFEIWLQYQYQSVCSRLGFQALVSAEIRNRAMYNYSLTETAVSPLPRYGTADHRRFTYSIFAGARYNMPHYDGYFSRLAFGIRAYHGNCPYGMFRSEDNFSYIGFSIVYQ